jgi:signal transduction histidine kinase
MGLGLSICRAIVALHGWRPVGRARSLAAGIAFRFSLADRARACAPAELATP